jgi:hypothetical protein
LAAASEPERGKVWQLNLRINGQEEDLEQLKVDRESERALQEHQGDPETAQRRRDDVSDRPA